MDKYIEQIIKANEETGDISDVLANIDMKNYCRLYDEFKKKQMDDIAETIAEKIASIMLNNDIPTIASKLGIVLEEDPECAEEISKVSMILNIIKK